MGISCARVAVVGVVGLSVMAAFAAGCIAKNSSGGGPGVDFDAGFDASFPEDGATDDVTTLDASVDTATEAAPVDSSAKDTGTVVDSSTPLDSGTAAADTGAPFDAGVDTGPDANLEGGCGPTAITTANDPDSGLPYTSYASATCNGFTVSCTCAADNPVDSCYCAVGNAAPGCLTGSLSDCGDQAYCGADLSSDTSNCGRCGHACPAGLTCSAGSCSPLALSFGGNPQAFPDDWVSDGTFIYESSCSERVVTKLPVGGVPAAGAPTVLSSVNTCPRGIYIDATNAYWVDDGNGTVWTAPLSGTGTPTQIGSFGQTWFSGPLSQHGIASDGVNLYFAVQPSSGYGFVYSMPKAGGPVTMMVNDGNVLRATIYVDSTYVYYLGWDNNGSYLKSVPKSDADGGVPSTTLATFPGDQPLGFLLQGNTFYVSATNSNTIWTVPKTGGTPSFFYDTTVYGEVELMATDGTSLYWTDFISGYVYVKPLAGGSAQRMAQGLTEPFLLLLDANNAYILSNYGGYYSLPVSYRP
jgi:hypothetical protein